MRAGVGVYKSEFMAHARVANLDHPPT
jgi:hypothetical protein